MLRIMQKRTIKYLSHKTNIILLSVLCILPVTESKSQSLIKDQKLEQIIEAIFPIQEEELNYDELYENLYQFYLEPIDLNATSKEELYNTYLLSPFQIDNLFQHIQSFGPLISIYEIQSIPGFDIPTIHKILPFVTVKEKYFKKGQSTLYKNIINESKNTLLIRYERTLEQKKGYTEAILKSDSTLTSRYKGSEDKLYMRLSLNPSRKLSIGLTAEKDAGEELIWDSSTKRYGADFISMHLKVKDIGKLKQLIVGDYQLQFGQGLVLGAGFAPGKGAETITTIRRANIGARPYTSVIEGAYFRGATATIELGKISLTNAFSFTKRDAINKINNDSLFDSNHYITALQVTGFHRTPTEIAAKAAIKEHVISSNVNYRSLNNKLLIGLTGVYTKLEVPRIPDERIYNQFEFRGKDNYTVGSYYSYNWQNINFFGEAAISKSGGIGVVSGAMINLSQNWEMSLLLRKFDKDFHTFYGFSFGENSRNINEKGIYLGLKYTYSRKLQVTAYFDQFFFPWLKYRVNAPSHGTEVLGRLNYKPNKKISFYGQYRRESKDINSDMDANIRNVVTGIKQNYLVNMDFTASDNVSIRSRVQFSNYQKGEEYTTGFVLVQDVNFSFWKLRASTRIAIFDTEDYDNRQYVYERDVLYAFSIPAYYGRGIRNYVLLQYNVMKNLSLWIRYARTQYKDKEKISSGLEEIDGDKKTDIKVQLRYKF